MVTLRLFEIIFAKACRKMLISFIVSFLLSCYILPAGINVNTYTQALGQPSPATPSSPTGTGLPTIQITSVQDGQQVPPGELTIQGISSDTEDTDCEVSADINDITPMRNVTASGESGDDEDFSTWTFTYTQDYQLISQGQNELTAKISCFNDEELDLNSVPSGPGAATPATSNPLNEWHTVNVTGVVGAPPATLSSSTADSGDSGASGGDSESEEDASEGLGSAGGDVGDEDAEDGEDGGFGGNEGLFG